MGIKKITKNMTTQVKNEEIITNEITKSDNNNEEVKTCDTISNGSDKNITTEEKYFQKCREEYYDFEFFDGKKSPKTPEETKIQIIDLIANNFEPWKNVDNKKVEQKDISGHGGSRTYAFTANDENVQENYRKLIFHKRNLDEKDPLTEERMCDAQKAFYDSGVGVPRYISGKNWYIEPFIEESNKEVPHMAKV